MVEGGGREVIVALLLSLVSIKVLNCSGNVWVMVVGGGGVVNVTMFLPVFIDCGDGKGEDWGMVTLTSSMTKSPLSLGLVVLSTSGTLKGISAFSVTEDGFGLLLSTSGTLKKSKELRNDSPSGSGNSPNPDGESVQAARSSRSTLRAPKAGRGESGGDGKIMLGRGELRPSLDDNDTDEEENLDDDKEKENEDKEEDNEECDGVGLRNEEDDDNGDSGDGVHECEWGEYDGLESHDVEEEGGRFGPFVDGNETDDDEDDSAVEVGEDFGVEEDIGEHECDEDD